MRDSLESQIVIAGVCNKEMVRWLANTSKDVDGLVDDLNGHATKM